MIEYMYYIIYASALLFLMAFAGTMALACDRAPRRGP
jgi:hypothetical protein